MAEQPTADLSQRNELELQSQQQQLLATTEHHNLVAAATTLCASHLVVDFIYGGRWDQTALVLLTNSTGALDKQYG